MISVGSLVLLLLSGFFLAALVFLIGGLAAFGNIRRSIRPPAFLTRGGGRRVDASDTEGVEGAMSTFHSTRQLPIHPSGGRNIDDTNSASHEDQRDTLGAGTVECSPVLAGRQPGGIIDQRYGRSSFLSWSGRVMVATRGFATREPEQRNGLTSPEGRRTCCKRDLSINKCISSIPFGKLRVLVVVWQILTMYPTVASVEYPPLYSRFLSWVDFVNLDLGSIFSASCVVPGMGHYDSLLVATLGPFMIALVLTFTYRLALSRAGVGTAGEIAKQAAWARHMAVGLLVSFLVRCYPSSLYLLSCAKSGVEEVAPYHIV